MRALPGALLGVGLAIALAAGCATASPRVALLQACDRYASTLTSLAARKAAGRLSGRQIDMVETVHLGVGPICESPPILDDTAAFVLPRVREGVSQLLLIEAQGETANDAR